MFTKIDAMKQIEKEFRDLTINPIHNICISEENHFFEWKITFIGPKNTPYEGGLFFVKIKFPFDYPYSAPLACFITPIYNTFVNPKTDPEIKFEPLGLIVIPTIMWWWSPAKKMKEVISEIYQVFYNVTPSIHHDGIYLTDEFRNNRALYENKAKYFTKKYADPLKANAVKEDKDWDFSYEE